MKRILVLDESRAVRETLLLILGKEFVVVQRPLTAAENLSYAHEPVDLLIFGLSHDLATQPSTLDQIASKVPFPVLFLVDSRYAPSWNEVRGRTDWLAKPFNPYDLLEKVRRLLAEFNASDLLQTSWGARKNSNARYLDYPYLPKAMTVLARRFALASLPVHIYGEMGCGQERLARAMGSLNARMGAWFSVYPTEMTETYLNRRSGELSGSMGTRTERAAIFLHGLENLSPDGQATLLRFLDNEEEKGKEFRLFSMSQVDLLEKVYRGDFLPALYFRLATLVLQLPPLRERLGDIAALATAICSEYGSRLGLPQVTLSPEALDRLSHYLWFGNIAEMECVLAQTLAMHEKEVIAAEDIIFGVGGESGVSPDQEPFSEAPSSKEPPSEPLKEEMAPPNPTIPGALNPINGAMISPRNGSGYHELQVLIHEMAHELKNPMVTIKTFAQLLEERFDDVGFRIRFQETVNEDIDRMDELVEALLEFSRFAKPEVTKVLIHEHLRKVLVEIVPECIKKDTSIRWGRKGEDDEVFVDSAQFSYVMENLLLSVLNQIKEKEEIQIDIEKGGRIVISYPSEGEPGVPLDHYMDLPGSGPHGGGLPLRMLLAKILVERNGGRVEPNLPGEGRVQIKIALPVP